MTTATEKTTIGEYQFNYFRFILLISSLFAGGNLFCAEVRADNEIVHAGIGGRQSLVLAPHSDTLISLSMMRPKREVAFVQNISGSRLEIDRDVVQVNELYMVAVMETGAASGAFFPVSLHDARSVELEANRVFPAELGIQVGDRVALHPSWTLASAFSADAFHSMEGETIEEVLEGVSLMRIPVPGYSINPSPDQIWTFQDGGWRSSDSSSELDSALTSLQGGEYFLFRSGDNSLRFTLAANLMLLSQRIYIARDAEVPEDHAVAPLNPTAVTLDDSGLAQSDGFAISTDALRRGDMVVVYDFSAPKINRSAVALYIFQNEGWRKLGEPLDADFGADLLQGPDRASFIRTHARDTEGILIWRHEPVYLR